MNDRNKHSKRAAPVEPLKPGQLRRVCDPAALPFKTTDRADPLDAVIGQDRAVAAIEFGIGIRRDGYNMFALGPGGTGKHTLVQSYLKEAARGQPTPPDWCYVNNFEEPHKPNALPMPPGRAAPFRDAMDQVVRELRTALPAAFESDEYRQRRQLIENEFKRRQEQVFEGLQERARAKSVALLRTPLGLMFAPVREGEVLEPKEFEKLSPDEQKRIQADIEELQGELQAAMEQAPQWEREQREQIREINREVTQHAVGDLIATLRRDYVDLPEVVAYLDQVEADVVETAFDFIRSGVSQKAAPIAGAQMPGGDEAPSFRRYQVNVIVDNRDATGAPVIYEDNPVVNNLIGRIEHSAQFGALITDFNLIKPGALHRANGGYLVLDARRVLMQPFAWEELKRTLRSGEIRIESLGQLMSIVSTVSLEPEAIPLDVKIVLVGERMLYHLLAAYDPEFEALFKVQAEFQDRMPLTDASLAEYARLIATLAQRNDLKPFDAAGVARVIEYSQRLADDTERLSTGIRKILDIMHEAEYWSGRNGTKHVTAEDVEHAIDAKIHRADWIRERLQEEITRGTILIATEGEAVGQVNGLSVLQLGGFAFGRPSRITARVRLGKGEVIDIERQVELGGPLHSKGVLILSGFLGERYSADRPLTLSASLVFEQSYGGVDGDSASSAELYALLSALSGLPLDQSFAVTGSVNQHGFVQAIGGVNEKIEGFFDVCSARGLTGKQGVLIPAANVKHLMLRDDVVASAKDGRFRIFPVGTIDQGISLLTGVEAGARGPDGTFPAGSVNARVEARLVELAEKARAFARTGKPAEEGD